MQGPYTFREFVVDCVLMCASLALFLAAAWAACAAG